MPETSFPSMIHHQFEIRHKNETLFMKKIHFLTQSLDTFFFFFVESKTDTNLRPTIWDVTGRPGRPLSYIHGIL